MVTMSLEKKCEGCSTIFITKSPIKRFCNQICYHKVWCDNNREKLNRTVKEYRARRSEKDGYWRDEGPKAIELKQWMNDLKSQPCSDCGNYFEKCCMDFDHRIGSIKKYNVATMFAHHYSRELIELEIAKCDLVCANCHRIRTRDRRIGTRKS